MTGLDISKVLKMIYESLFSPSTNDELYKPSTILPGMFFYYLVTIIVVIVVLYLALNYIGFDWGLLGF
jgi:small-conductance mechanosensitive channel